MTDAVAKAMTAFHSSLVNATEFGFTRRRLRTFDDGRGTVLGETVDGRWLDAEGRVGATTGAGDWPHGEDGRPLDGGLTGSPLAEWERKLIDWSRRNG